jgi:predicted Zn-dependent protease
VLSTVKHELGHAMGFYHTDQPTDLMYAQYTGCDKEPSEREQFHARVTYTQPNGSRDPS